MQISKREFLKKLGLLGAAARIPATSAGWTTSRSCAWTDVC